MTPHPATPAGAAHKAAALDKAAALALETIDAALYAHQNAPDTLTVATWATVTQASETLNALLALGASNPRHTSPKWNKGASGNGAKAAPVALDLGELASLDTPATRELLRLLEAAQDQAEIVDAARGRVLPDTIPLQPGESRGTDLAEAVSEIALRVRCEVGGIGPGRE